MTPWQRACWWVAYWQAHHVRVIRYKYRPILYRPAVPPSAL
jgi:hypothetical protein